MGITITQERYTENLGGSLHKKGFKRVGIIARGKALIIRTVEKGSNLIWKEEPFRSRR